VSYCVFVSNRKPFTADKLKWAKTSISVSLSTDLSSFGQTLGYVSIKIESGLIG